MTKRGRRSFDPCRARKAKAARAAATNGSKPDAIDIAQTTEQNELPKFAVEAVQVNASTDVAPDAFRDPNESINAAPEPDEPTNTVAENNQRTPPKNIGKRVKIVPIGSKAFLSLRKKNPQLIDNVVAKMRNKRKGCDKAGEINSSPSQKKKKIIFLSKSAFKEATSDVAPDSGTMGTKISSNYLNSDEKFTHGVNIDHEKIEKLEPGEILAVPIKTIKSQVTVNYNIPRSVTNGHRGSARCVKCDILFFSFPKLLAHDLAMHPCEVNIVQEIGVEEETPSLQALPLEPENNLSSEKIGNGESKTGIQDGESEPEVIVPQNPEVKSESGDGNKFSEDSDVDVETASEERFWKIEIIGGALGVEESTPLEYNIPYTISEKDINPFDRNKHWLICAKSGWKFKICTTYTHGVLDNILCVRCITRFSSIKSFLVHTGYLTAHIDYYTSHLESVFNPKEVTGSDFVMRMPRLEWTLKTDNLRASKQFGKEYPVVKFLKKKQKFCLGVMGEHKQKKRFKFVLKRKPRRRMQRAQKKQCPDCLKFFCNLPKHLEIACKVTRAIRKCTICDFSTRSTWEYKRHMSKEHKEGVFRCPECNAIIKKEEVHAHFQDIHGGMEYFVLGLVVRTDRVEHEAALERKKIREEKYPARSVCPYCAMSMTTGFLKEHIIIHHTFAYPYKCEKCDIGFINYSKLEKHMVHHQNEQFCKFCERYVVRLDVHRKKHHVDTCWHCTFCKKGFTERSGLKKHLRSTPDGSCTLPPHERILPRHESSHYCHLCGRGFSAQMYLTRHLRKHCPKIKENGGYGEVPEQFRKKADKQNKRSQPIQLDAQEFINYDRLGQTGRLNNFDETEDFTAARNIESTVDIPKTWLETQSSVKGVPGTTKTVDNGSVVSKALNQRPSVSAPPVKVNVKSAETLRRGAGNKKQQRWEIETNKALLSLKNPVAMPNIRKSK